MAEDAAKVVTTYFDARQLDDDPRPFRWRAITPLVVQVGGG